MCGSVGREGVGGVFGGEAGISLGDFGGVAAGDGATEQHVAVMTRCNGARME